MSEENQNCEIIIHIATYWIMKHSKLRTLSGSSFMQTESASGATFDFYASDLTQISKKSFFFIEVEIELRWMMTCELIRKMELGIL